MIVKEYPTSLAPISGFLTLKAIKKLTAKDAGTASAASKLLGCLIPILTIMDIPYTTQDASLKKKFAKAKEF
jgi:TATA-binding protein-associated factor